MTDQAISIPTYRKMFTDHFGIDSASEMRGELMHLLYFVINSAHKGIDLPLQVVNASWNVVQIIDFLELLDDAKQWRAA